MAEESFSAVSTLFYPDLVMGSAGPSQFFIDNKENLMKNYKNLRNIPPEFIFSRLCSMFPQITALSKRFLIFEGQKHTLFYTFAQEETEGEHHLLMYTYNLQTREQVISRSEVAVIAPGRKDPGINIFFRDGSIVKIPSSLSKDHVTELVADFYSPNKKPSAFELAIKCISLMHNKPTNYPLIKDLLLETITQRDMYYVRKLLMTSVDSKMKKALASLFVYSNAEMLTLNYFLRYMVIVYFNQDIKEFEILRSDCVLTCVLAVIRETNAPHFFEMFAESINRTLVNIESPDEALSLFLSEVKTITIPSIIRGVCRILYDEAQKKFPGTDAPFYAVSGFFFLRSLGPYLMKGKNKKVIASISALFNFTNKPEVTPYIQPFKEILQDMSKEIDKPFMFVRPSKEDFNQVTNTFLNLIGNDDTVIKLIEAQRHLPGEHPHLCFIKDVWDLCEKEYNK